MATKLSILITLIFLFLQLSNINSKFIKTIPSTKTTIPLKQKISHLHFYFHDIVSGQNPSATPIIQPPKNNSNSLFGMVMMMDDPLTETPDPKSKPVGQAQGFYACAAQSEIGFLQAMNLYFTQGKYNGSVLTVVGRNAPLHPVRELPVIGGSGLFRFATGYALAKTYWFDFKTGDAIVEYNLTVLHY